MAEPLAPCCMLGAARFSGAWWAERCRPAEPCYTHSGAHWQGQRRPAARSMPRAQWCEVGRGRRPLRALRPCCTLAGGQWARQCLASAAWLLRALSTCRTLGGARWARQTPPARLTPRPCCTLPAAPSLARGGQSQRHSVVGGWRGRRLLRALRPCCTLDGGQWARQCRASAAWLLRACRTLTGARWVRQTPPARPAPLRCARA